MSGNNKKDGVSEKAGVAGLIVKKGIGFAGDVAREGIRLYRTTTKELDDQIKRTNTDLAGAVQDTKDLKQSGIETANTVGITPQPTPQPTTVGITPQLTPQLTKGGGKKSKSKSSKSSKSAKSAKSAKNNARNNEDISANPVNLPGSENNDELSSIYGNVGSNDAKPHIHNKDCGCSNCSDKIVVDIGEESSESEGENYPVPITGAGRRRRKNLNVVKKPKPPRKKSRSRSKSRRSRSKSKGKCRR